MRINCWINHMLSPIFALKLAFKQIPLFPSDPAFITAIVNGSPIPMTGKTFNATFKNLVKKLGLDPSTYSSHSFRRGGATWALKCGIPGVVVQQMGDWQSDCYKQYLDQLPQSVHDHYRRLFFTRLP